MLLSHFWGPLLTVPRFPNSLSITWIIDVMNKLAVLVNDELVFEFDRKLNFDEQQLVFRN